MSASLSLSIVHPLPRPRPVRRRPSLRARLCSLRQAYARFAMLDLHR